MTRILIAIAVSVLLQSMPANAGIRVSVSYSETADLFSAMDDVSGWWKGFVNPRYRDEWQRRFGWSEQDEAWAKRYAEYRHRTYSDDSQGMSVVHSPHGLFGSSLSDSETSDPLASYLLDQPNIMTAMANLETFTGDKDAQMLRGFYNHFEPKWRVLLSESAPLHSHADALSAQLESVALSDFIDRVSVFYGTTASGTFRVFFTRFPPGTNSSAEVVAGNSMLLHSPTGWKVGDGSWDSTVMHEFVHYISARQPDDQKRRLSNRFLKRCPIPAKARRLWMIEEPLAVAIGQAAYSLSVLDEPLEPRSNWYSVPWIDLVGRTLVSSVAEALASGTPIERTTIVEEAADRCLSLTKMINTLQA